MTDVLDPTTIACEKCGSTAWKVYPNGTIGYCLSCGKNFPVGLMDKADQAKLAKKLLEEGKAKEDSSGPTPMFNEGPGTIPKEMETDPEIQEADAKVAEDNKKRLEAKKQAKIEAEEKQREEEADLPDPKLKGPSPVVVPKKLEGVTPVGEAEPAPVKTETPEKESSKDKKDKSKKDKVEKESEVSTD